MNLESFELSDNGSNIVKAFKCCLFALVKEKIASQLTGSTSASATDMNLDESFIEDNGEKEFDEYENGEAEMDSCFYRKKRVSCFAHNAMLAVRKAIDYSEDVKDMKKKVHLLIAKMTKCPKATEILKDRTDGIGLIKPVETRWIYWYYVFNRLRKIKKAVCEVCDELNILHDLGPVDWKILEEITEVLSPFAAAVMRLEGESYATISEVYPILFSLQKKLNQMEQRASHLEQHATRQSILGVIHNLASELDSRFKRIVTPTDGNFDPIYVVATLLDNRYALLLEGMLLDNAKSELKLMVGASKITNANPINNNVSINLTQDDDTLNTDLFTAVRAKIMENRRSSSESIGVLDQELEAYILELKTADTAELSGDPFSFWSKRKERFPSIYNVAVDILSIPATSAPVEWVFSRASFILCRKRHNLEDKKLESELFYKVNMEFMS